MSQIVCKHLKLGYDSKTIIENLDFTVNAGDYLAIIGENGAGKTTLMKAILKLAPIKGGEITIDDVKFNEIGYLSQQTIAQSDFPASAQEIVLSGFQGRKKFNPFYTFQEKKIALQNMKRMDILDFSKKSYRELSGGQKQRVLLARALCAAQKILLLDEPVAGLDQKSKLDMYETIKELNNEGITIIMISHNIEEVLKYATHILCINSKPFFGAVKEYLKKTND